MRAVAAVTFLLSFAASTSAYLVITPNAKHGWTNQGPQSVTWTRVVTDPLNFTLVLDNQSIQGFKREILGTIVDGTPGQLTIYSDNGWPTGQNFRLNFVKDNHNLDTILAQSGYFTVGEGIQQ